MGILDHKISEIAAKIMEHIDLEEVTREVMSKLVISNLDMYFVVKKFPDSDTYDFIGLTYDRKAAGILALENSKASPCRILMLDPGKILALGVERGVLEDVICLES